MNDSIAAQSRFVSHEFLTLLNDPFFLMPNWKWIALAVIVILTFGLRPFIQYGLRRLKRVSPWAHEKEGFWAYWLELPTEAPLSWIIVGLLWLFAIDNLLLPVNLDKYLTLFAKVVLSVHVLRLIYISVDAFGRVLEAMAAKTESKLDDVLAPFVTKTLKVLIVVLGGLIVLQNFGLNVMGLLAGLGLGGLALALAAQDTAANVFGSITILLDRPFMVGDWIKVGDTEGTVEEVGFRSTRIRSFYNSLIAIPNATVAKEKIDNMGVRRRRRVRQVLGLHYDTPPAKIDEFCEAVRYAIMQEPKADRDGITAVFNNFGASTLDVLVAFHLLDIADVAEEQRITQKLFGEIITMSQKVGVTFAYPTQMVYHLPATPPAGVAMLGSSSYQDPR